MIIKTKRGTRLKKHTLYNDGIKYNLIGTGSWSIRPYRTNNVI
jgi:hypothetical protein